MEFSQLLQHCLVPGGRQAEQEVLKLQNLDKVAFALACSKTLQDASLPIQARHLAICLLKNVLPSAANEHTTALLRAALLQALESLELCSSAACCCQRLAVVMPWPELAQQVLQLSQRGYVAQALKTMALLAEEGFTDGNAEMTQVALAALRAGPVQVAMLALQALQALVMRSSQEAAASAILAAALQALEAPQLRSDAWRLLESCASVCYSTISPAALQQMMVATKTSINSDGEDVASRALDVWETLAAQELDQNAGSGGLLQQAAPMLLPTLHEALQRKPTDTGWTLEDHLPTLQESACECLMAVSKVLGNAVLQPVLSFVSNAMASQEIWQRRAALLAFGAVQEGPSAQTLQPLIHLALPRLLEALKASALEASAAAWAMGRLLDVNPAAVPDEAQANLFEIAVLRLRHEPGLAEEFCYCLNGIVDQQAAVLEPQLFGTVVESLLLGAAASERESRVQLTLFGCLLDLLGRAGEDCVPQMHQIFSEVLRLIDLELQKNQTAPRKYWSCISVLLQRIRPDASLAVAALLKRSLTLDGSEEEALRAIGSLARLQDQGMLKQLWPYLLVAAGHADQPEPCEAAVTAMAEVVKAMGEAFNDLGAAMDVLLPLLTADAAAVTTSTRTLSVIFEVHGSRSPRLVETLQFLRRAVQEFTSARPAGADRVSRQGPRLPQRWSPGADTAQRCPQNGVVEAVLLAHESLMACYRKQGVSLASLPEGTVPFALQLLATVAPQRSCRGATAALRVLQHLSEEMPADLRRFLATDCSARVCAVELVNAGTAGSKAQRQAAEKVRSLVL